MRKKKNVCCCNKEFIVYCFDVHYDIPETMTVFKRLFGFIDLSSQFELKCCEGDCLTVGVHFISFLSYHIEYPSTCARFLCILDSFLFMLLDAGYGHNHFNRHIAQNPGSQNNNFFFSLFSIQDRYYLKWTCIYRFDIIFNNKSKNSFSSLDFPFCTFCVWSWFLFIFTIERSKWKKNPFHYDWVFSFPFWCWYNDSLYSKSPAFCSILFILFFSPVTHIYTCKTRMPIQLVEILLWSFNIIFFFLYLLFSLDRWIRIKFHTFAPSIRYCCCCWWCCCYTMLLLNTFHISTISINLNRWVYFVICCMLWCIYLCCEKSHLLLLFFWSEHSIRF